MFKKFFAVLFLFSIFCQTLKAGDLDDGIGGDDPIEDNLQINKNIEFIKRNAMAKALSGNKNTIVNCGAGNQTFAPGANLKGATIVNLSNNKNAASICGKKASAAE